MGERAEVRVPFEIRVLWKLYTSPAYLRLRFTTIFYGGIVWFFYILMYSFLLLARPTYRPYEVIVPALVILSSGALFSHAQADWSWFARSGSFLVVIAATMHIFNVKKIVENAKQRTLGHLDGAISKMDGAIEQHKTSDVRILDSLKSQLISCRARFADYDADAVERTYKRYEVIAAIVGTVVCGGLAI